MPIITGTTPTHRPRLTGQVPLVYSCVPLLSGFPRVLAAVEGRAMTTPGGVGRGRRPCGRSLHAQRDAVQQRPAACVRTLLRLMRGLRRCGVAVLRCCAKGVCRATPMPVADGEERARRSTGMEAEGAGRRATLQRYTERVGWEGEVWGAEAMALDLAGSAAVRLGNTRSQGRATCPPLSRLRHTGTHAAANDNPAPRELPPPLPRRTHAVLAWTRPTRRQHAALGRT